MDWQRILYFIPGIIIGLTVHEFSHAYASFKLGDTTARDQGRLTLNPLKHLDIIGVLFIIFAGFGWAKPVQFNPGNLLHPRRDKAIIAAAGPASNLIIGILFCLIIRPAHMIILSDNIESLSTLSFYFYIFSYFTAMINIGLFLFNLLPIPPLDGSHIVFSGLNLSYDLEEKIRKIGLPVLFVIMIIQSQFKITIIPIGKAVAAIMGLFL